MSRPSVRAGALFVCALCALLALMPDGALALSATATVSRTTVTLGEPVRLAVTVTDGSGDVDLAPLESGGDFDIVSRSSGTSISVVNGDFNKTTELTLQLMPTRAGTLTIPPLTVGEDDETVRTAPITITVREGTAAEDSAADGETPPVFMRGEPSNTDPYVGEELVYTLKIFSRVRIANPRLDDSGFEGFTAKQIPEQDTYTVAVQGKRYSVVEVSFLLTPLRPGPTPIGPITLHCDIVSRPTGSSKGIDRFFSGPNLTPRVFRAPVEDVTVRELPPYEGDAPFSGLVGDFSLALEPAVQQVRLNESAALTITVSGAGNVMDAPAPEVDAPDSFKVYADAPEEQVSMDGRGHSGSKTFGLALVPLETGRFTLPPVSLTFFDPESERYVTAATDPIRIDVTQGDQTATANRTTAPPSGAPEEQAAPAPLPPAKQKVEFLHKDILPLKQDLSALETARPLSPLWFLALLLLPPAAFGGAKLARRYGDRQEDVCRLHSRRADELLQAAAQEDVRSEVLSLCAKGLVAAVRSRTGRSGESLTYDESRDLLLEAGEPPARAQAVRTLFQDLDAARYGAAGPDRAGLEDLLARTKSLVKELCV